MRTQPQKAIRAMSAVGLLAGDQSEMFAAALRARRSSNFAAVRVRRRRAARAAPMTVRMMTASRRAKRPGRKLASLTRTRWEDWRSASSTCCHMSFSPCGAAAFAADCYSKARNNFFEWLFLWVESVGPAPAGYEVRFVGLKGNGEVLNVLFGCRAAADEREVRGDPGEIERRECAEKVSAVDGAETEGEDEVVDDAGPEVVGHAEVFGLHEGELLESEERVGRKDERPYLVKVGVGEAEGVEHGGD